jgi:hypothetical protein
LIARPEWSCKIRVDSKKAEFMWRSAAVGMSLMVGAGTLVSGCAATCGANPQKLAELRRGMNYGETAEIMGCEGKVVSPNSPASGEFSTVEWNGPQSIFFTDTQIDFLDGRLLSYTTGRRGGL